LQPARRVKLAGREMTPGILRHLLLKIPVDGLLAADKAAAVVVRAEQIDTGAGSGAATLQCDRALIVRSRLPSLG
jgi:hypothetical protein